MALSTEQIVKILQLQSLGTGRALKVCEIAKNKTIYNDSDLQELILGCIANKWVKGLPVYSKTDFVRAFQQGLDILEKSNKAKITVLSCFDVEFPSKLSNIDKKPIVLSFKGNYQDLNSRPGIAIIGTREPTEPGRKTGEYCGEYFGKRGFNVVSGLAKGCDSAAHIGCLRVNGMTTAIVAHGLDIIYPKENKGLATEILDKGGVLLSEYFIGKGPKPNQFVERDRLQAGLALATIVIQTGIKGGTMHAVNATIESKKFLAAIKYNKPVDYDKISGNEMLIKESGAFPLTSESIADFVKLLHVDSSIISIDRTKPNVSEELTISNAFNSEDASENDLTLTNVSESLEHNELKDIEFMEPVESEYIEPPEEKFMEHEDSIYHEPEEDVSSGLITDNLEENISKPKESKVQTLSWSKRKIAKPKKYVTKGIGGKRRVPKKNTGNKN